MITVYAVAYNEEFHIKFMIDHYRLRFPSCNIVVYDNCSSDRTAEIAKENGAEVISFDTNNRFSDIKHIEIKNSCWKNASTNWVLTCDVDELLDINEDQLKLEENLGSSIITSEGYTMINMPEGHTLESIKYGCRQSQYDKSYLFNKNLIKEINYEVGCHRCSPIGQVKFSDKAYLAYHYKFIDLELSVKRYQSYGERMSDKNIENGWGKHYFKKRQELIEEFDLIRSLSVKLL